LPDGSFALCGDKWFCSNADAELALVLARPAGAPVGIKGVGLFLLPRALPDGRANAYRVVRLKDCQVAEPPWRLRRQGAPWRCPRAVLGPAVSGRRA
jgi:alkylation response protein AidB-like acyl-CoA dehydrogenase